MRYLKNKISLKIEAETAQSDLQEPQVKFEVKEEYEYDTQNLTISKNTSLVQDEEEAKDNIQFRGPRRNKTSANSDSKNIVKNYGKALCAFASSKIAVPYIEVLVKKLQYSDFDIPKFMEHMKVKKETTNSMEHIRTLLMVEDRDSDEQKMFKKLFKEVSIIFMKYFAANWIYSGKLKHKSVHMKFRFKMLRRVQNPEHFTYLKTSAGKHA